MKRWVILLAGAVVILGLGGLAWAGDYHYTSTLICYDCHTMHYSGQHDYAGNLSNPWPNRGLSGPYGYLLINEQNALCLSCHDQKANIPDVLGADFNSTGSGGRQAGALTTGSAPYEDWRGHTLGANPTNPPGGTWPGGVTELRCSGCHSTHGSANYRNLGGKLASPPSITYAYSTTPANTTDVRISIASLPGVGSRITGGVYSRDNTFFNELASSNSPYGDFCAGCHGNFHGVANTGSATAFTRHPTEDVNFTNTAGTDIAQYNAKGNKVQVLFASNGPLVTYTTTATPSCMSCHKAHGNQNPFGLIYMVSSGTITEEGVSGGSIRDLCGQCHTYGN